MAAKAPTSKLAPTKKASAPKAPAARKRLAAGKPAGPAAAASVAASKAKPGKAEVLLRAGLKALGNVRDDVVKRQTNVIEGLLGIQPKGDAAPARGFPSLDSFGIRKFEDVFDQRVATALERLGMPTLREIQELRDEVRELRERLDRVDPPAHTVAKTPASPARRKR